MFIQVHGNGLIPHRDLREFVQKKVESSFARFAHQIAKVDAHLADLNGPKRGVDKSIRLVIDIERKPVIVIEQRGEYWSALVEGVVDRCCSDVSEEKQEVASSSSQRKHGLRSTTCIVGGARTRRQRLSL